MAQCHGSSKVKLGTVEQRNSGTAEQLEHTVAELRVKNVGTVAQCHSDSNSATVRPEVN